MAGVTWNQAIEIVTATFKAGHAVATVWHPGADTDLIPTSWGSARAVVGDVAQYQLSTGEIVKF